MTGLGIGFVVLGQLTVAAEGAVPSLAGYGALAVVLGIALLIGAIALSERNSVDRPGTFGSEADPPIPPEPR